MSRGDRGFTLVEMLISIVILVLLTGMLLDGLRLATHHLGYETALLDRSSQVALVQDFLRSQLADAQPVVRTAGARVTVDFAGNNHHLVFVSPAPRSVAFGGFQRLSLDFDAGTEAVGGTLQAGWQPYRVVPGGAPDDSSGETPDETNRVLLDHVGTAVFSYFGSTTANEPPAWHYSWQGMNYLPALIRLSVVFSDGRTMPELIVALRLATWP